MQVLEGQVFFKKRKKENRYIRLESARVRGSNKYGRDVFLVFT